MVKDSRKIRLLGGFSHGHSIRVRRDPRCFAALAVHVMSNTALTGATYDMDGGQQLVS